MNYSNPQRTHVPTPEKNTHLDQNYYVSAKKLSSEVYGGKKFEDLLGSTGFSKRPATSYGDNPTKMSKDTEAMLLKRPESAEKNISHTNTLLGPLDLE